MKQFVRQSLLPSVVFITGACVLIVEVVAVRVLSPFYGNTMFTVSSVISVILAALSIGYYLGGKLADRYPSAKVFFGAILSGGLTLLGLYALGVRVLPMLSLRLSLVTGPLLTSLLLFFLPALVLGMLSPYAIKLQTLQSSNEGVGSISGRMFFWSTFGSISGSLLAGFVLIPRFGIDRIFIATSIVLVILGGVPLSCSLTRKKRLATLLLVVVGIGMSVGMGMQKRTSDSLYERDGIYEKIRIYDSSSGGRPIRVFQQDRSSSGAMFLDSEDPKDLVYDYTKYYALYKVFTPNVQRALVIGGGAYSIPKALLSELPNATIDVSEIEPSLASLAEQYFRLPKHPHLRHFADDGRRLLRDSTTRYDLIFSDVYFSLFSIPAQFTTQDFFSIAKDKLSDDGIFVANLIGDLSRQRPSLLFTEIQTFQSVFPNSYVFATQSPSQRGSQNIVLVGLKSDTRIDLSTPSIASHADPFIRALASKRLDLDRFALATHPVLTDTYAPVEYLTTKLLAREFGSRPLVDGLEMLATIEQQLHYGSRAIGATGHRLVQAFLRAEMLALAEEVVVQAWDHTAVDGQTYALKNIVARFSPKQKRRVILGTHYDSKAHADQDKRRSARPVPGANDSASGVAVMIEVARLLREAEVKPNVGVDLVFFDGEEGEPQRGSDSEGWRPLGSTYFADHIDTIYDNQPPEAAIVLDMVCDKDLEILKEPSSFEAAPALTEGFWALAKQVDSRVFSDRFGPRIHDDHTALQGVGIPSVLLIDYEYAPFHTTADTLDKCSAKSLETVTRAVMEYLYSL